MSGTCIAFGLSTLGHAARAGPVRFCERKEALRTAAARWSILGSDSWPGGMEPNWYGLGAAMLVVVAVVVVVVVEDASVLSARRLSTKVNIGGIECDADMNSKVRFYLAVEIDNK